MLVTFDKLISMSIPGTLVCLAMSALPAGASGCGVMDNGTIVASCTLGGLDIPSDLSAGRAEVITGGGTWIAPAWQSVPFMFAPDESAATMRTSLSHVLTYARESEAERLRKLAASAPKDAGTISLQAPQARPPLDVWTTLAFDRTSETALTRRTVGADLRLERGTIIGLALERGEVAAGEEVRVGTYFRKQAPSGIAWGLQAGWTSQPLSTDGDAAATVSTGYLSANAGRIWRYAGFKLAPSVEVATAIRNLDAGPDGESWASGKVVVAHRISRAFELDGKTRIEPFAALKQTLDANEALGGVTSGQSIEGGLKLDAPSQFSLSATTALENSNEVGRSSVSGRLQLRMPLQ
jgi:hypothetical protein